MCVYCNRSTEDVTACQEQVTPLEFASYFFNLYAVMSSVIYYSTHTWENVIYLLNITHCILCSTVIGEVFIFRCLSIISEVF